mgnify:CR=1 FL=1|tara:strand:+ start:2382 stop:2816 length:435 start_codon:yes stop_codon:yes gene_type:complete
MEICNCTLAIDGDVRATIQKPYVSIAEIVVLQHLHGGDAVNNIKVVDISRKTDDEERDHLGKIYKDGKIIEIFTQYGKLPHSLKDARINDVLLDPVWLNDGKPSPHSKKPVKEKKTTQTRARNDKGHYIADDPNTPENEAFVEE